MKTMTFPDFQNMHLSMTTQDSNSMETILPSFHRPDLLQYWAAQVAAVPAGANNQTRTLLPPAVVTGGMPPPTIDDLSLRMPAQGRTAAAALGSSEFHRQQSRDGARQSESPCDLADASVHCRSVGC